MLIFKTATFATIHKSKRFGNWSTIARNISSSVSFHAASKGFFRAAILWWGFPQALASKKCPKRNNQMGLDAKSKTVIPQLTQIRKTVFAPCLHRFTPLVRQGWILLEAPGLVSKVPLGPRQHFSFQTGVAVCWLALTPSSTKTREVSERDKLPKL